MSWTAVNIELPKLHVAEKYVDKSNTPVVLENGFHGNVHFEPWNDFEELVDVAINEIEGMGDLWKRKSHLALSLCREEALKPSTNFEAPQVLDNAQFKKCDAPDIDKAYCRKELPSDTPPNGFTDLPNESKKIAEARNISVCNYSSCESAARVTELFFMAVENMMCGIKRKMLHVTCLNFAVKELDIIKRLGGVGNLRWERIKPDFSLSEVFELPPTKDVIPYATVEFKGPARVLFKWNSLYNDSSESGRDQDTNDGGLQHDNTHVGPTLTPLEASTADKNLAPNKPGSGMPASVDEEDANRHDESDMLDGSIFGSARQLAMFCNAGFASIDIDNPPEDGKNESSEIPPKERPPQCMMLPIAQALSQGLITMSGCCILFNYQQAIAFKICGMHPEKPNKVQVLVSRVYCCDCQHGTVSAIVGLMLHAMKRSQNILERETIRDALTEAMKRLLRSAQSRGPQNGSRKRFNRGKDVDDSSKRQKSEHSSMDHNWQKSAPADDNSESTVASAETNTASASHSTAKTQPIASASTGLSHPTEDGGGIVEGYSGIVRIGMGKDGKVVRKRWNGDEVEGLEELWNEIAAYEELSNRVQKGRDFFMPALKGAINNYEEDAELTVEYVGTAIEEVENFHLVIGEGPEKRKLNAKETIAIRAVALDALRYLHQLDWSHGDVALRNLRVMRTSGLDPYARSGWRVWWIDYGKASKGASRFQKALDIECCKSLFRIRR